MSKGNKSIIPLIILFCAIIVVSLVIFYFIGTSQNIQTLSEDQKIKAKEIALNDSVVHDKIGEMQRKYYSQDGWKFNMSNPVFYTVGNVTIGKVHEISPGVNRTRYLPSVELVFGHVNLSDINLYAYVDLEKGRVAYIGFTGRSGPSAAGYYYIPGDDGVVEHIENIGWSKDYKNITIADTLYKVNQQLTDAEKSGLLDTAMKNETVMSFLNGTVSDRKTYEYRYTVYSDEGDIAGHHFVIARPNIHVSVKRPDGSYEVKYFEINFDGMSNKVVSADIEEIFIPPYISRLPGTIPSD
jgi:hypothetical protein